MTYKYAPEWNFRCGRKIKNAPGKYLGVWIHRDLTTIINMNYGRAIDKLEEQVDKWIKLPMTLADRIAIIKMVILPKFLYFFYKYPDNTTATVLYNITNTH